jgi:hypothetical protein
MSTCDFTVTIQDANNQNFTVKSDTPASQSLTIKSDTSQCCTINVMNDVDITESSANNTILVWDTEFNLWVRRLMQANNISGLSDYIANYLNTNDVLIDILDVSGNVSIGGTLSATDIDLSGNLSVDGDIILKGSTLTIGDGGDVININATVNNHLVSTTTNTFDLGSTTKYWRNLYVKDISVANNISVSNITVVANVDATIVNTTDLRASGNVYASYYYGDGTNLTISKHQTEAAPATLANGQLHYSFSSDKLFIGQTSGPGAAVSVEYIGGKLLVDKVANLESVVGISSDSATFANTIISGILRLSSYPDNAALRTKAGGVVEAITGSFGEIFQVAANGSPYFDDLNGGTY